jgi:hypothetical protein
MSESPEQQRARLAYEVSLRALEQQRHEVAELRSHTGILIAAASLGASFLGARALAGHASPAPTLLALAALVTTLVFGTLVLVPRDSVTSSVDSGSLYEHLAEIDEPALQHRQLATWLDSSWMRNRSSIVKLKMCFQLAATALVVQVVAWTVAIVDSL